MGGSAPSIPVADAQGTAPQQQNYNVLAGSESQAGSNVNQVTPFGSLSYQQTGTGPGGIPTFTATTQLTPQEQALLNTQMGVQGTAGQGSQLALKGVNYTDIPGQLGSMTSGLTGQQMSDYMASVAPYQQQALGSEAATLANQGLTPGNKAYDLAMQNFVQGQNQANLGAAAQFEPQAFSQALQTYETPIQTAQGLFGMSQPASLSQNLINTPTASYNPVDFASLLNAQNQAATANAQLQNQQYGSQMSGMFGIGSAALKALPMLA